MSVGLTSNMIGNNIIRSHLTATKATSTIQNMNTKINKSNEILHIIEIVILSLFIMKIKHLAIVEHARTQCIWLIRVHIIFWGVLLLCVVLVRVLAWTESYISFQHAICGALRYIVMWFILLMAEWGSVAFILLQFDWLVQLICNILLHMNRRRICVLHIYCRSVIRSVAMEWEQNNDVNG